MWYDAREIGRLAIIMESPGRYIERRIEDLHVLHDHYFRVHVRQQVTVPHHGGPGPTQAHGVYLPIGWYSKSRLPSLIVRGDDGSELPLMPLQPRAQALAIITMNRWHATFHAPTHLGRAVTPDSRIVWDQAMKGVAQVATARPTESQEIYASLRLALREFASGKFKMDPIAQYRAGRLAYNDDFWEEVASWIETTLLVARCRTLAGSTVVLSMEYAERFPVSSTSGPSLTAALQALGLVCTPIVRRSANAGKVQSLYVTPHLPEGVEAVRFYWKWQEGLAHRWDPDAIASEALTLSARAEDFPVAADERPLEPAYSDSMLEVQLGPSDTLGMSLLVTTFLWIVATFIFENANKLTAGPNQAALVAIAGAFSGLPAVLTGAIAFRSAPFGRRISRAPRVLLAGLSAATALLAAVVAVRTSGTEAVAFAVVVYAFLVMGYLGYLAWGMRFRHSDRGRLLHRTMAMAPVRCRQSQVRFAACFCVAWVVLTVVFARIQYHLRVAHVFTGQFPGNLAHAVTSWF